MDSQRSAQKNFGGIAQVPGSEEAQIKQMLDSFAEAIEAKDIDRIMSFYSPDIVAFDMMAPLKHTGIRAWRKVWQAALPMMEGTMTSEMLDLNIDIGGDVAVCQALLNVKLQGNRQSYDTWMRWTAGLHRTDGVWLITHEHTSVPADMQTGRAMMNLQPDSSMTH